MPKLRAPRLSAPRRRAPGAKPPRSRGASPVVGLEIGATQLIAAQAHLDEGRIVADRVVVRPLPTGLVEDGLVADRDALVRELRAFFKEHRLGRRVRVGLATPRTILRVIDLPPLGEGDIRAALAMQAQDRIPMPLNRAVLDHQTIGLVDTPDGPRLRVVVVATEREGVEMLFDVLKQAGLRPEGIDLSVFAAMRAVARVQPDGPVLYAQLGDLVNLAITEGGVCQFTRQAPQGLALVLQRLSEARSVSVSEAHELLIATTDHPEVCSRDELSEVGALLARVAGELGSELRAAAEFYGNQSGVTISEAIVTGPLARLKGFVPALADASNLELHCGEVLAARPDALSAIDACVAPVAVGLTIARVGS